MHQTVDIMIVQCWWRNFYCCHDLRNSTQKKCSAWSERWVDVLGQWDTYEWTTDEGGWHCAGKITSESDLCSPILTADEPSIKWETWFNVNNIGCLLGGWTRSVWTKVPLFFFKWVLESRIGGKTMRSSFNNKTFTGHYDSFWKMTLILPLREIHNQEQDVKNQGDKSSSLCHPQIPVLFLFFLLVSLFKSKMFVIFPSLPVFILFFQGIDFSSFSSCMENSNKKTGLPLRSRWWRCVGTMVSQILRKLRQEHQLSSGVWGHPGQHIGTQQRKRK